MVAVTILVLVVVTVVFIVFVFVDIMFIDGDTSVRRNAAGLRDRVFHAGRRSPD